MCAPGPRYQGYQGYEGHGGYYGYHQAPGVLGAQGMLRRGALEQGLLCGPASICPPQGQGWGCVYADTGAATFAKSSALAWEACRDNGSCQDPSLWPLRVLAANRCVFASCPHLGKGGGGGGGNRQRRNKQGPPPQM